MVMSQNELPRNYRGPQRGGGEGGAGDKILARGLPWWRSG